MHSECVSNKILSRKKEAPRARQLCAKIIDNFTIISRNIVKTAEYVAQKLLRTRSVPNYSSYSSLICLNIFKELRCQALSPPINTIEYCRQFQLEIEIASHFFKINRLKPNAQKTKSIHFSRDQQKFFLFTP